MKKAISILLSLALAVGLLTGCSAASTPDSGSKKLRIVTTIFPEYDWVREILGDQADHVELTMLLDDGVDLHSFQPTADDMIAISNCDLFLYTGGESDSWVEDALASAANTELVAMNLMEVLGDGVKAEEAVEGMQESEHHHHEDEEHHEDSHEHHEDCDHTSGCTHNHDDEHIWLSLKHAAVLCNAIAETLSSIDPAHQVTYSEMPPLISRSSVTWMGSIRPLWTPLPSTLCSLPIDSPSGIWQTTMDLPTMRHSLAARQRQRPVLKPYLSWPAKWMNCLSLAC